MTRCISHIWSKKCSFLFPLYSFSLLCTFFLVSTVWSKCPSSLLSLEVELALNMRAAVMGFWWSLGGIKANTQRPKTSRITKCALLLFVYLFIYVYVCCRLPQYRCTCSSCHQKVPACFSCYKMQITNARAALWLIFFHIFADMKSAGCLQICETLQHAQAVHELVPLTVNCRHMTGHKCILVMIATPWSLDGPLMSKKFGRWILLLNVIPEFLQKLVLESYWDASISLQFSVNVIFMTDRKRRELFHM